MADTSHTPSDLKTHVNGYEKFTALFKWGAIVSFILTAIVVYLIAS